jgi:cobalt-zinc-cadmium efflux system outer membrane protein
MNIEHSRPAGGGRRLRFAAAGLGVLALAGCAAVPREAGFPDVQKTVAQRLDGKELRWNRGTEEDKAAMAAVRRLLEEPLTADSAVQIALLNNQGLQGAYEELGVSQAELVRAGLLENPVFSADILVFGGPAEPSLGIVQNFLSLLTLSANRRAADAAFESAKLEVGNKVLDLAADVRAGYYKLLADQQALELFRQVADATGAAADLAQRQVEAGAGTARDQAAQQTLYAQAVLEHARAEAELAADREAFNRLLGLWGEDIAWNLPDRLPDVPEAKPGIDGLETLAVERRLDLAAAKKDVEMAGYALDLGRTYGWLGPLGVGVSVERTGEGKWLKGPSLEFGIPLFNQGQPQVAMLEAQLRQRERALNALGVNARSEVREAWTRLVAAQEIAAHYKNAVLPLHQRVVAENQRLYNGMLIGVYDLLRSKQEQIAAARDYIGALKEYWVARAELERAIAGPMPAAGTAAKPKAGVPLAASHDNTLPRS